MVTSDVFDVELSIAFMDTVGRKIMRPCTIQKLKVTKTGGETSHDIWWGAKPHSRTRCDNSYVVINHEASDQPERILSSKQVERLDPYFFSQSSSGVVSLFSQIA